MRWCFRTNGGNHIDEKALVDLSKRVKRARSRYFKKFWLILLIMSSKRQIGRQGSFICKIMAT